MSDTNKVVGIPHERVLERLASLEPTLRDAAARTLDAVTAWLAESKIVRPRSVDAALVALGTALEDEP